MHGMTMAKSPFTPRELEVCLLVAQGLTNKQVGRRLGISHRTVEHHRAKAMAKVGARNIVQLLATISREGQSA